MKRSSVLYAVWGILYAACAGLGFADVSEAGTPIKVILGLISALFFLPPFLLLREGDEERKRVRRLAILSLELTTALMVGNVLSAFGSSELGDIMQVLLNLVSVPMIACGYWAASLFLWACLLFASLPVKKK